jgi:hypothetical protein
MRRLIFFALILFSAWVHAQDMLVVHGIVTDEDYEKLPYINVSVQGQPIGTSTNNSGYYKLELGLLDSLTLVFSSVNYENKFVHLDVRNKTDLRVDIILKTSIEILDAATVEDAMTRKSGLTRLDPNISKHVVSSIGVESLIKSLPGTSSNNELSSQYNVRGGNFDENLVYVNDVLIYRPLLIRSGQQEGLSFINSDMVASLLFSAGGFDATYGDKMSSVLDISYRKPIRHAASFSGSFLGGSAHLEGLNKTRRFRYLIGARYKTNRYLLGSLDTEGQYNPNFADVQSYLTYDLNDRWEMSFLGHYGNNVYEFKPETGETTFGTFNEAYKLKVYFEGLEKDAYQTGTGAMTFRYHGLDSLNMKFILSGFYTAEKERFDILGQYYLNNLETNPGEEEFGDSISNIGVGSFLNHANNKLNATVYTISHIGQKSRNSQKFYWGGKYQFEDIGYVLKEWKMIDSAGYSLPFSDEQVLLYFTDTSNLNVFSHRGEIYGQHELEFSQDSNEFSLKSGLRANYWSYNQQLLLSPRVLLSLDPNWMKDIILRVSSGLYHQPPFFREMIRRDGSINENIKAQSSAQFVLGGDYVFKAWGRPFKLMSELYVKYLWNVIPYEIDNVRIRYFGENNATGYAVGLDLKVNGEFVKGTESWFSLSLMQTKEDIHDDFYINQTGDSVFPGYLRRPSDQRVNFNIFFQDYLPGNDTWKAHLNLVYGTGLPFGPPNSERYEATGTIPAYRRVDLGISKQIISKDTELSEKSPFRFIEDFWISLEAFNLLDINNTISHIWVSDIYGRQYAVPNYLTGQRINLKFYISF